MNKENAHEYLPIVQALANGKQLQYRDEHGNWSDTWGIYTPSFEADPTRYRIKPEPRTFEIYVHKHTHKISQLNYSDPNWERITVQEVLE